MSSPARASSINEGHNCGVASACTPLVGYILSYNEADNIAGAVDSLLAVTDIVIVVDSGSADATEKLATEQGATVFVHEFENFASQRNWALAKIVELYKPAWVFALDADERLSPELAAAVRRVVGTEPAEHDAYLVSLRVHFAGQLLRFGGARKTRLLRLFNPHVGTYEQRSVNEHFVVTPAARVGRLDAAILHEDVSSWERHIDKQNRYSTLEAEARYVRRTEHVPGLSFREACHQPQLRRRWLREVFWERLPAKALIRFVHDYLLCGGLLDGGAGLKSAWFAGWHEMCIDLKYRGLADRDPLKQKNS